MTDAEKKFFERYVTEIQHLMGLGYWAIEIDYFTDENPKLSFFDDNTILGAVCDVRAGMNVATISFNEDSLEKQSDDETRETVVHELLHCFLAQMQEICEFILPAWVSDPQHKSFMTSYNLSMERTIDAISREWAKHMPPYHGTS